MNILLLDKETEYTRQLGCRVAEQFPHLAVYACHDSRAFETYFADHKGSQSLCLYNPADFPDMERLVGSEQPGINHGNWKLCRLVSRGRINRDQSAQADSAHADPITAVERAGDYSRIAVIIEHWYKQVNPQNDLEIVPQANTIMLYLDLSGLCCDRYVSQSLTKAYQKGYRTLYLPLMPLYHMRLVEKPDKGSCLSDLLLKMSGEIITVEQISHYWQATSRGWYQFRPPAFSDDLLSCSAGLFRKLISLIKTRVINDTEASFVLLDCRNMPFDCMCQMAVLCNHVFIRLPAESDYALASAEKEAARLINQLPAACAASLIASDSKRGYADAYQ